MTADPGALVEHEVEGRSPSRSRPFVPNMGQWSRSVRFVQRRGPRTLFLEDRGWVLDSSGPKRGVALRMSFLGAGRPRLAGENRLAGVHNYFLGADPDRWRTGVPRFGSVLYQQMYAGIDVRLRDSKGVPEYDLLLEPGADLAEVEVRVDGGRGLLIREDGSLVVQTELGPFVQTAPVTWRATALGERVPVACTFVILGVDRFGFTAPTWDGGSPLTIDPGMIWSTFVGGAASEVINAQSVDRSGRVTVAGQTASARFPTTVGAYDRTIYSGTGNMSDAFISRFDPRERGARQLVYSTFLGGAGNEIVEAVAVDDQGVVTVVGQTRATPYAQFPTTSGAFDVTHNGYDDVFVSRLDPRLSGAAQLVYSTFLGGKGFEYVGGVAVDGASRITVAGRTDSSAFPTTAGAFDRKWEKGEAFVARLDPSKTGSSQLVYSTFFGGRGTEDARSLVVDSKGVVTIVGHVFLSGTEFPVTPGAFGTTYSGVMDAFVARLDPAAFGARQLVYSTFLGASGNDYAETVAVEPDGRIVVAGHTGSRAFPVTSDAFGKSYSGGRFDAFVCRLDPRRIGRAQLAYSTLLGGGGLDHVQVLAASPRGVFTMAGFTTSPKFPTTPGAFDTSFNEIVSHGEDGFVLRLDPRRSGRSQLVYSTFLGGRGGNESVRSPSMPVVSRP